LIDEVIDLIRRIHSYPGVSDVPLKASTKDFVQNKNDATGKFEKILCYGNLSEMDTFTSFSSFIVSGFRVEQKK
jgi:hypothetical protein